MPHGVEPLLVEGLVKRYGEVPAVDSLDLTVARGLVAGLVGPNGSGKTTTLRAVVGLVRPDAGRVLVNGIEQRSLAARASVAFVPDEPGGLDELALAEFLALYRALYRAGPDYEARAHTLLRAFGLEGRARAALASLSHGLRRQASLVAALALSPPLVVVDEATAALDPEAVVVLREVLRSTARRGSGVLLATQDLHFAETACDHLYLLSRGRLVAQGTLEALRSRYRALSLEGIFLAALGRPALVDELRGVLDAL